MTLLKKNENAVLDTNMWEQNRMLLLVLRHTWNVDQMSFHFMPLPEL